MSGFKDGLVDMLSKLANTRSATNRNSFYDSGRLNQGELRAIYKLGITSKIFRLLTSYALNNTIVFGSKEDEEFYEAKLKKAIKRAAIFQLAFGRGIIVINERGADLSKPATSASNLSRVKFDVFSGDEVTVQEVSYDLQNPRYYKPMKYQVRGYEFHHSRVIDLTYYEPIEFDKPNYLWGGISLSELIYRQLVNDSVIERASASIVEKNSTLFYKVTGFKQNLQNKKEGAMVEYFSRIEDSRSIYGAGLIDSEDEVESISQSLTNLKDSDDISLRRLAMVTGIPLPMLIGENVKGLNSAGDTERDTINDTIKSYQELYLLDSINEFMQKLGKGYVKFKDSIGMNASEQASYESKCIDNAVKLTSMGEDGAKYIEDKGVVSQDDFDAMFPESNDVDTSKSLEELFNENSAR